MTSAIEAAERQRRRNRTQQGPDARVQAGAAEDLHVGRAVGKRTHPAEGLAERGAQALGRERHLQLDARGLAPRSRKRRRLGHFIDGRDARDRFLRKLSEGIRNRADQSAVDIHGAAAHARNHAGVGQRAALEPRENQVAAGADDVAQNAKNVDLELVEPVALEDRLPDAHHPGFQLVHGEGPALGRRGRKREQTEGHTYRREVSNHRLVTHLEDTGKPLKLQGPADRGLRPVDTGKPVRVQFCRTLKPMPKRFSFFVSPSYASYWWWYRTATEGAARHLRLKHEFSRTERLFSPG